MTAERNEQAKAAAQAFRIDGALLEIRRYERGHIHDTYVSTWQQAGGQRRFLHQRMNATVFHDIAGLMHNVERVTRHLGSNGGAGFHTLELVPTRTGDGYLRSDHGPWRTYGYLENTESHDRCEGPEQAFEAARAFGEFQARLADLDPAQLCETIPRFFSSPHRMAQLEQAVRSAPPDRLRAADAEIRFALERRAMVDVIEDRMREGVFPPRIVHGDTKLNNVLFDVASRRAVCVVDLDTCMPAYSLYDFGDLVRFTAATCAEDERDLSQAGTCPELYRALEQGYLESAGPFLTRHEIELMPFAAKLVTFTIGLRFLADYLAGDVYFKIGRPGHNLDRARVQLRMVEGLEQRFC